MSLFFEGKKVFFISKCTLKAKCLKYNNRMFNPNIFFKFSLKFLHNKHALSNL